MSSNGNGYHPTPDIDEEHYESLIVPGRGKLEGMSFASDPRIEEAVRTILTAIGDVPDREGL